MKFLLSVLGLFFIIISCSSTSQNSYSSIRGFDLSDDNRYIFYSLVSEKQTSIRRYNIEFGVDTVLLESATDKFHTDPQLSPGGDKLAFIESNKIDFFDSKIGVIDISTFEVEYFLVPNGIISSIMYSTFSEEIYFLLAQEYGHYSPIGVDAAHRFDLYSINLNTQKIQRLANEEAYGMYNLEELDSLHIAFFMREGKRAGVFEIRTSNPNELTKVAPKNDARTNFYVYGKNKKPVYGHLAYNSENNMKALVCAYELLVMDRNERVAKSIMVSPESGQFADVQFFNKEEDKILFTKVKNPYFHVFEVSDSTFYKLKAFDE